MTTILHVEDDEALAEMVATAFEAFGFRGATLIATTLEQALAILGDVERYPVIDLVISDMQLPDGTGLDVVRTVRSSISRAHIPILILSGETDPEKINRAYALGASSYVSKGTRGRSVSEMVKALHDHWLQDARLPAATRADRTHHLVATAVRVQTRKARLHMQLAEQLGISSPQAEFWMDLALREGNLANLMSFLIGQLDDRDLGTDSIVELSAMQAREIQLLDALEQRPLRTQEDLDHYMYTVLANACGDAARITRATGQLFPVVPVAMATLVDTAASSLEEFAAWVETHATDRERRELIPQLRAGAQHLRDVPDDTNPR